MSGEILVAQPKPGRLAEPRQRIEHVEGLVALSESCFVVEDPGQSVDDRVNVRTDQQSPELVVIGGVGDDRQVAGWQHRVQARG